MELTIDGAKHLLHRHEPLAFPGDAATTCKAAGRSVDLNVMAMRSQFTISATVNTLALDDDYALPGSADAELLVAVLEGSMTATDAFQSAVVRPLDVVRSGGSEIRLRGAGTVQVIRLQRHDGQAKIRSGGRSPKDQV